MKGMVRIGELAAEILADAGSKRFGLKDRGTEAPRQVFREETPKVGCNEPAEAHSGRLGATDPVSRGRVARSVLPSTPRERGS